MYLILFSEISDFSELEIWPLLLQYIYDLDNRREFYIRNYRLMIE